MKFEQFSLSRKRDISLLLPLSPVMHNFKFVNFNCIAINLLSTDKIFFNNALMLVACAETSFERIF